MKNWRTTFFACGAACVPLLEATRSMLERGQPVHWGALAFGIGLAAFGVAARDAGSKEQPK